MAYTATDVANGARIYLNDEGAAVYTDTRMLEIIKSAIDDIKNILLSNGCAIYRKSDVSNSVLASAVPTAIVIDDMITPIELLERTNGSSDPYTPMVQRDWEPDIVADDSLRYWTWREEQLFFPPCTTDKQLMIRYLKDPAIIADISDTIPIINGLGYLKYRAAAVAALTIGEDPERAEPLAAQAMDAIDAVIRINVKQTQSLPKRRQPYRRNTWRSLVR